MGSHSDIEPILAELRRAWYALRVARDLAQLRRLKRWPESIDELAHDVESMATLMKADTLEVEDAEV